jgi:hypothetical protein
MSDVYEDLMSAHRELPEAQSQRLDAALVLLLAHRLADPQAYSDCLRAARQSLQPRETA